MTTIVTRTDDGSTSTPPTRSPSSSTGESGKSRSMSMPEVSIGTMARTCTTRAMSDSAPRTVAVWIDCCGGLMPRPSGTVPGTTTTGTTFGSTFSSLTDTKAGVAASPWIRGSADSTTTRTDWLSGPGCTWARSTCALKFAELIVTFDWSVTKYWISVTSPSDPMRIVPAGWFAPSIWTVTGWVPRFCETTNPA